MLSVIIPAYKEPHLNKTIRSLIFNKREDIEIIVVLDGATQDVYKHHRVHVIELPTQLGMRGAVNLGVKMARGDFIMKCDAHCKFGKGFDLELKPEHGEVMIPRMYDLDCDEWKEFGEPADFYKLIIHPTYNKFHGKVVRKKTAEISETLGFQGSCWVMRRTWFDVIGFLDERVFSPFGHESVEISFKTWQNGGKLLVTKRTWYAHPSAAKRTHKTKYNREMWGKVLELYREDYKKYVLNHALY